MRAALLVLALFAAGLASSPAEAHGGRARVHIGVGWYYPFWYWPGPYYHPYYPSPVVVQREEPVYVERGESGPQELAPGWWYYCEESKTYYPYVLSCPSGWKKVSPTPQAPR